MDAFEIDPSGSARVLPGPGAAPSERRGGPDRRRRRSPLWGALLGHGRRRAIRRAEDLEHCFTDHVSTRGMLLVLFVFVTSILDLFLTLVHLSRGATEANWIMAQVLERGVGWFAATKIGVTVVCCIILAAHAGMRIGNFGLWLVSVCYGALLVWHLVLFAH